MEIHIDGSGTVRELRIRVNGRKVAHAAPLYFQPVRPLCAQRQLLRTALGQHGICGACWLSLRRLWVHSEDAPLQPLTAGISAPALSPFWHHIRLLKGNAPVQEEPQTRPHGMTACFHNDKLPLGDGFQLIRRIKAQLKGLPPAIHRQQALSVA